jgi:adenine-specific DNA-methyltransferase
MTKDVRMNKITAADPAAQSADLVAENIAQLKALFPELITEGADGAAINVDVLKQLVGDATASDAEEKYGLNWHGKRRARQLALTPSTGTLRPCPEDSVDWDTTQNLMIEGDNLEVLKLLQKSYAGKVKLIYIDPPYNTGKDFVYPDNFQDSIKNYLELTGQVDGGRKITSNTEASGRFHTDWLNMMYSRLKVARNFLSDDGLILISCDESELSNLYKLGDEIFGTENFIGQWNWYKSATPPNLSLKIKRNIEYVVAYEKSRSSVRYKGIKKSSASDDPLTKPQNSIKDLVFGPGQLEVGEGRKVYEKGVYGTAKYPNELLNRLIVKDGRNENEVTFRNRFVWTQGKLEEELAVGTKVRANGDSLVLSYKKADYGEELPPNLIDDRVGVDTTEEAAKELDFLFGGSRVFDYPKPTSLIRYLLGFVGDREALILDFFAGSGTTAQAVMEMNSIDTGTRRYIVVQLPEPLDGESETSRNAVALCESLQRPQTISEITKERIRRAAQKIKSECPDWGGDAGFRVLKLDQSNIRAWQPSGNLEKDLVDSVEHIVPDRSEQDVLAELLLKLGLDLCVPIEQRQIAGKAVHAIGGGVLLACLDTRISKQDAEPLALAIAEWHQALAPVGETTCVFRDSGFENDEAKTNLAAILDQHGIHHVRSL